MDHRQIHDFSVNPIGLGCMGLSAFYGPPTEQAEAIKLLHAAIELGVNHFDTAEMYGLGANEKLLGDAFADRRDKVRIATKFGPKFIFDDAGKPTGTTVDGTPENMRRAVENSLAYLKTDVIDLYYLHRVDPNVPIEETVGAMGELVREGKVRALGLSEASRAPSAAPMPHIRLPLCKASIRSFRATLRTVSCRRWTRSVQRWSHTRR